MAQHARRVGVAYLKRHLEMIMLNIGTIASVLAVSGCIETTPEVAISEPDPELIFVRGYRSAADDCRLVGESAFTLDFLDDAADLVACSTGSTDMDELMAQTGVPILTQTNSYTFFSVPRR